MKRLLKTAAATAAALFAASVAFAQQPITRNFPEGYDPHYDKIIPDKVFEIGAPLLALLLLANAIINIIRIKAETRLKEKALDRQISEATLIKLFGEERSLAKYAYLKNFLVLAALGASFICIFGMQNSPALRSGYLSVGFIAIFLSIAFLIYYIIIRRK